MNLRSTLSHAVPISAVALGLFYYWFSVADRYAVFLYGHLEATPFDAVTRSRYWMAGLVASGIILVVYTAMSWLWGRVSAWRRRAYAPPPWLQVWALCAGPLVIGIPLITMTQNQPTLPFGLACAATLATLAGLALALAAGHGAALRPRAIAWLTAEGAGLVPPLLLLRVVELPARGLVSSTAAWGLALGSLLAAAVWLGIMAGLRAWRRRAAPSAVGLLAVGLTLSYLIMPLVHYLVATPADYRYISTAGNFFAGNPALQAGEWIIVALLALAPSRLHLRRPT